MWLFGFRIQACRNNATDDIVKLESCQCRQDAKHNRVSIEMACETCRHNGKGGE